jgi:hypothetical protein
MNPLTNLRMTLRDVPPGPGLAALVIVVLGLGVGGNTVLFAIGLAASYLGAFEHSANPTDL